MQTQSRVLGGSVCTDHLAHAHRVETTAPQNSVRHKRLIVDGGPGE